MTNRQIRQYEMLARVKDFAAEHGNRIPEATLADEAFAEVGDALGQLREHFMAQLALRRKGAKARAAARAALVAMMEAISRTARVIELEEPGFTNTFLIPKRKSAPALIAAARLFARDAEPLVEKFALRAMPATFLEELNRLLANYEQTVRVRETGLGQSAAARLSIEAAIASGTVAARKLDVMVANHLGGDFKAMAEWQRTRRIGYRSRAPETPVAPAEPPPDATPIITPTPPPDVQDDEAA